MLSKEEEFRLEEIQNRLDSTNFEQTNFQWLAKKLKETNDELKDVNEEVTQVTAENFQLSEKLVAYVEYSKPIKHCGRKECSVCDEAIATQERKERPTANVECPGADCEYHGNRL
jgi:RNA polymerase-binding transcription factor DksA